jgi:hypothetical protein
MTLNYRGGLFAIFAEVPQASGPPAVDLTINISHVDATGTHLFGPTAVKAFRLGVSWTEVQETGAPPPPPPNNVDFDTQVYPLFLPLSQGGFGCQGCHTSMGGATPSAGMDLGPVGGPATAYASLDPATHPLRVNLQNPPASLILVNPLYNAMGSTHPIFAFTSVNDPGYQTILKWIQEGAKRNPPMAQPQVTFAQVQSLLVGTATSAGAGCANTLCHGAATPPAPGAFSMLGTPRQLFLALTSSPAVDQSTGQLTRIDKTAGAADNSLLLLKPLEGCPLIHPVKIFASSTDPRYQLLYRWIAEGFPGPQ